MEAAGDEMLWGKGPATIGDSENSLAGWCRPPRSHDEMGSRSRLLAPDDASLGPRDDPPRCRHNAPLSMPLLFCRSYAHISVF